MSLPPVTYRMIKQCMENFQPKDEYSTFLPQVCILELASEKSVASTLSSSKLFQNDDFDEVIDYVAKKTPRLFLSLIFAGCLPLLEVLVKNNFTDDDLPIAYEGSQDSASEIQKLCETDRLEIQFNSARPSKYFSQLDEKPLDDFIKDQWAFLAHVFPDREFSTYVFHPSRRFPYSPPANQVRHAGSFFSVVWNVILHDYDSNCVSLFVFLPFIMNKFSDMGIL